MLLRTLIFCSSIILMSCGGGSSNSSSDSSNNPPPPVIEPPTTNTTGVITGFGSVFVNGVKFETSTTEISTDDNDAASESDLQVGMIVTLSGEISEDGATGTANSIHYEEQLKGPLESIDLAQSSMIILGQTVVWDELTTLDDLILDNLIPGDFLEVSGFFNTDNQLYATRIELEDDVSTIKIQGIVSSLDTNAQTFMLGEITIDYSLAEFKNFTLEELANDITVRVKGDATSLVEDVFTISDIKQIKPDDDDNDRKNLEGIITAFDSSSQFVVNGITVVTDENTEFVHGSADSLMLNIRIQVKGEYLDSGDLLANEIRVHQRTNLKIEGHVQAVDLDASTVTLLETTFTIDERTKMLDKSDNKVRFFDLTDINIEDFIEVKGYIDQDGSKIATKLTRNDKESSDYIELKGQVSNIAEVSFVVLDVTVTTTTDTVFKHDDDVLSQQDFFELLAEGNWLEVKGEYDNNTFIAVKVEIETEDDDDSNKTEFRGLVEEILDDHFVIAGKQVFTSSITEFEYNDDDISEQAFRELVMVGDQVKVKGSFNEQDQVVAKSIELETEDQQGANEAVFWGTPSVENEVLMVLGHAVEVSEQTEFKSFDGKISHQQFLENIDQWQITKVKGILLNENLHAKELRQEDDDKNLGKVEIEGKITQQEESYLVAEHLLSFSEQTEFKLNDQEVDSETFFAEISDIHKVEIKGVFVFTDENDSIDVEEIKTKN